jgi:ABC-2 type transport system ATP-binding protein
MLRLVDVKKSFGRIQAVDGLSLDIGRGEVFGLLGPNGAGKTTALSMVMGLLAPDSGSIEIEGKGSTRNPAVRRVIGVAPQTLALYDDLTAEENLVFFASLYGIGRGDGRKRASELLTLVGLADRAKDRVKGFSGGMKRRLNLGAALVGDPEILLLDEPTAGVDPQSRQNIVDAVLALRERGRTIVYTTHFMEEAQRVCDRVGIMDKGRLLALGTMDDLIRSHGGMTTVVVETPAGVRTLQTSDPVAEVSRATGAGDVLNVRVERPNLESVFFALTGRSLRD